VTVSLYAAIRLDVTETGALDRIVGREVTAGGGGQRATKYLALGWWRMIAEVVCSGWYW
jgi:hypothetical protein